MEEKERLKTLRNTLNRKMDFSSRMVFVYTCIVIIPLVALFLYIIIFTQRTQYAEIRNICTKEVTEHVEKINANIHTFSLLDTMIETNNDLMLFYTIPETCDEDEIIETTSREATTIERLISVMPSLYAVRIFADNPLIPERWPVILNSSRSPDLASLGLWEFNYSASYMGNLNSLKAQSVCSTRRLVKSRREIGWLQISMKMSDFFPFLYRTEEPYHGDYVFRLIKTPDSLNFVPVGTDKSYSYNEPLGSTEVQQIAAAYGGGRNESGTVRARGKHGTDIIVWRTIPELGIIVVHTCSTHIIGNTIVIFMTVAFIALFCSAVLLYFLTRATTSRLLRGVYSVMDGMKRVRSGDFDVTIPVTSSDEVGESQQTFNSMTERLRTQVSQIKNEQQLIADTEMKAMQNQINAHFLYNVLETIRMQAVLADENGIAESIMIVGKMMRYCLRWRVHTVTLAQEIEYIRSYVYILNIRNDYVITLDIQIPELYETLTIPKMLLQPFVENAFNYGIEPRAQDAVIRISAEADPNGTKVWMCVQDFGCGMSAEKLAEIRGYLAQDSYERDTKGSIGIKNIQQRLTMFFGKEYRLEITSEPGKGTLVHVPVPADYIGKNEKGIETNV